MPKQYTFWRNCIVAETFVVEAESEEEARELVRDADVVHEEWIDWLSDDFELEDVKELDPLYVMVKEYENPKYKLSEEEKDLLKKVGSII